MSAVFNIVFLVVFPSAVLIAAAAVLYGVVHFVLAGHVRWTALPKGARLRGFLWPPVRDFSAEDIPHSWLQHISKVQRALTVLLAALLVGAPLFLIAALLDRTK